MLQWRSRCVPWVCKQLVRDELAAAVLVGWVGTAAAILGVSLA